MDRASADPACAAFAPADDIVELEMTGRAIRPDEIAKRAATFRDRRLQHGAKQRRVRIDVPDAGDDAIVPRRLSISASLGIAPDRRGSW